MQNEMKSLQDNKACSLVQLPKGRKIIATKWVFKRKCDNVGNIIRHKARLEAKGCSQEFGYNYIETFSPVVR